MTEAKYTNWMSNTMLVNKFNNRWSIYFDYSYLNIVCPKKAHPLPNIQKLVDKLSSFKLLLYMDAYCGSNKLMDKVSAFIQLVPAMACSMCQVILMPMVIWSSIFVIGISPRDQNQKNQGILVQITYVSLIIWHLVIIIQQTFIGWCISFQIEERLEFLVWAKMFGEMFKIILQIIFM